MFAVIRTGGKQYRVSKDDVIAVESLAGAPGDAVTLDDVLMVGEDGKAPDVGAPRLEKAAVLAEVVEQTRGDKIIVFKKQKRKGYRRKAGHRQNLTLLRITGISLDGKKPAAKPKAKAAPEKAEKPAAKAEAESSAKAETKGKADKAKTEAPQAKAKSEPKGEAKPKADAKTEAKSESKAKDETKAKGEAKAKTEAKAKGKSEASKPAAKKPAAKAAKDAAPNASDEPKE